MPKVYCIADALDEMDDKYGGFLAQLKELGNLKPANVKVLLTSRPIPRIEANFYQQGILQTRLEPTMIYPDVVKYVKTKLSSLDPRLSAEKDEEVKEAICAQAKGLFLHARLMTDNLIEGLQTGSIVEETLPASLERLPQNLQEVYTSMLAEHSRRSGVSQEQQLTILQCVTHSSRPLRLIELGSMVSWMRKDHALKEGKELVKASCGRLLEILEDETVSVIHHSFTEFLRDKARSEDNLGFPILDPLVSHRMLAIICLQYLESCPPPDSDAEQANVDNDDSDEEESDYRSSDWRNQLEEDERTQRVIQDLRMNFPLHEYATNTVFHHVSKANPGDSTLLEALDVFFQKEKPVYRTWLMESWESHNRGNISPIHVATFLGLYEYTKHLLNGGVLVDERDGQRRTALSYASEKGFEKIAEILLAHGADPDSDDRLGLKPLHYAAQENKVHTVRLLLAQGVHPLTKKTKNTAPDDSDIGETPLQYACREGHVKIITEFTKYLDTDDLCRCLDWAVSSQSAEAAKVVLDTGKVPVNILVDNVTPLFKAAVARNADMIRLLLQHGANPNMRSQRDSFSDLYATDAIAPVRFDDDFNNEHTPIHGLAGDDRSWQQPSKQKAVYEECIRLLTEAGGDVNAQTHDGHTALHTACRALPDHNILLGYRGNQDLTLAEVLLAAGADPKAQSTDGETPLHTTDPSIPGLVDLLVRYGASVDAKDKQGGTPLHNQMAYGRTQVGGYDTILKLIGYGADIHTTDDHGCTVVHQTFLNMNQERGSPRDVDAARNADQKSIKLLVDEGVNLNQKNNAGTPPVFHTGWRSWRRQKLSFDLLSSLVRGGLDLEATDSTRTTLLLATVSRYTDSLADIEVCIKLHCSVAARDQNGSTVLHLAVQNSDASPELLQCLVDAGADPRCVDYSDNTLLHTFARRCRSSNDIKKLFKTLVNLGIPMESRNSHGQTPLHLACKTAYNDGQLASLFLDGKLVPRSDVNVVDQDGFRPIHCAASSSSALVGLLLQAGADPTVLTHQGLTPLHVAAYCRRSNATGLLLSECKRIGKIEELIDQKTSATGETALALACQSGQPETVRYLLENGANACAVDDSGSTPLHAVAKYPAEEAPWRAQTDVQDARFALPLNNRSLPSLEFHSPTSNATDIIDMLVKAGANLSFKTGEDSRSGTPMDQAVKMSCVEMVYDLRRRGLQASDALSEHAVAPPRSSGYAKWLLESQPPPEPTETPAFVHGDESTSRSSGRGRGRRRGRGRGRGRGIRGPQTHLIAWIARDSNSQKPEQESSESMKAVPNFENVLKARNQELFKELVAAGASCIESINGLRLTGIESIIQWGHASLLEHFSKEASEYDATNPGMLLLWACVHPLPRLHILRVLIEKIGVDVNAGTGRPYTNDTALHALAAGRHFWNTEAVDYLVQNGADIEALNHLQETPLMIAVTRDSASGSTTGFCKDKMIRILLERGANPNTLDKMGRSCLARTDQSNILTMLIDHGADVLLGSALHVAIENRNIDTVTLLLASGADPNILPPFNPSSNYPPRYPLHETARRDDRSWGPLPTEEESKRETLTRLLVRHGADPLAKYDDGSSVFQRVIEEHGVLEPFWDYDEIDVHYRGEGGRTFLISVCFPTLPPQPQSSYTRHDPEPILILPTSSATPATITQLLLRGADIKAVDTTGRSALHWLCAIADSFTDSHQAVISILTTRAPELVHLKDKTGITPIHLAFQNHNVWAFESLVSLGADSTVADLDGNNALHHVAPRLCGEKERAAEAAQQFKTYLSLGVPLEARNKDGETPLFAFISASWVGSTKDGQMNSDYAVKNDISHRMAYPLFSEQGADVFVKNGKGETLLHATAKRWYQTSRVEWDQREDMVAVFQDLVALGLDPRAEDEQMRTAIDVAVVGRNDHIVDLFRDDGDKEMDRWQASQKALLR